MPCAHADLIGGGKRARQLERGQCLWGVVSSPTDERIAALLRGAGVDFACVVPCALLAGTVAQLERLGTPVLSVTREEEGVGICGGAALGGRKPALLLQNSGLGNSANALASLHQFYHLPLVLVVGFRGGAEEKIAAQRPMGEATEGLLHALGIPFSIAQRAGDSELVQTTAFRAFTEDRPCAVLLRPGVWE